MRATLALIAMSASSALAAAGTLQKVNNFGTNPTNAGMYIYVPSGLPSNPALITAIHYCTGSASAFFSGTQYANLADQYKFIVIYPDAPPQNTDRCWDVNTSATLKHDAGGDSLAIANMVRYAISTYKVDTNKVFATGTSSGAMMSNVLAGSYPDLFRAIAPFAGVPFGCFAGSSYWNSACATGQSIKTGAQWGDLVRAAYPGYTGPRPRMQIWHGDQDTTLNFKNYGEQIKQWTNVLGLSETPTTTENNWYSSGWVRRTYGQGQVQGIVETGRTHDVQVVATEVLKFFGIIPGGTIPTTTPPTSTTPPVTTTRPVTTTTASGPQQTQWGQCGGIGWTGATSCVSPFTCTKINDYYYQCL